MILNKNKPHIYKLTYTKRTLIFTPLIIILVNFISCSSVDYFTKSMSPNLSHIKHNGSIKLVTYNIKAIYDKEEYQVDTLMNFINLGNFDFVIFQELFDESTRDYIIEKTDTNHFRTIISRVDYNSFPEFIFQDAGLYMMGRYPRIDLSDIEFDDDIKNSNGVIHMILEKEMSKTNDFLANKSVLGTLFSIDDSTKLFLFTTHVQAIGTTEHKEFQLNQIKEFINLAVSGVIQSGKVLSPNNLVVILAGDFNSNAYSSSRFNRMMKLLGYPRDLHKEFHKSKPEYTFRFRSSNPSRRFDYILAYDRIGEISLKKVSASSINAIDFVDDQNNVLSDHLALRATIKIHE